MEASSEWVVLVVISVFLNWGECDMAGLTPDVCNNSKYILCCGSQCAATQGQPVCCASVVARVLHVCGSPGIVGVAACVLRVWQPVRCVCGSPCAACVVAHVLHGGQPVCCVVAACVLQSGSSCAAGWQPVCCGVAAHVLCEWQPVCYPCVAAHVLRVEQLLCCMYSSLRAAGVAAHARQM